MAFIKIQVEPVAFSSFFRQVIASVVILLVNYNYIYNYIWATTFSDINIVMATRYSYVIALRQQGIIDC